MSKNMKKSKRRNKGYKRTAVLLFCMMALTFGIFMKVSVVDASADVPERYKYYTSVYVDRDDTLWGIAEEYATEEYADVRDYIDEVKRINHLTDDELPYGITICVPYFSEEFK